MRPRAFVALMMSLLALVGCGSDRNQPTTTTTAFSCPLEAARLGGPIGPDEVVTGTSTWTAAGECNRTSVSAGAFTREPTTGSLTVSLERIGRSAHQVGAAAVYRFTSFRAPRAGKFLLVSGPSGRDVAVSAQFNGVLGLRLGDLRGTLDLKRQVVRLVCRKPKCPHLVVRRSFRKIPRNGASTSGG